MSRQIELLAQVRIDKVRQLSPDLFSANACLPL